MIILLGPIYTCSDICIRVQVSAYLRLKHIKFIKVIMHLQMYLSGTVGQQSGDAGQGDMSQSKTIERWLMLYESKNGAF